MSNEIVPFGKYKGHHVEELLRDSSYLEWCLANGVIQKYPSILQIVNNYNVIPNDTPEHNAMQIKYFEKAWQMAFLKCVHPELFKGEQKLFYLNGKDAEEEIEELKKNIALS